MRTAADHTKSIDAYGELVAVLKVVSFNLAKVKPGHGDYRDSDYFPEGHMTEQEFIDGAVKDQTARAMLAALKEALPFVGAPEAASRYERRERIAQWQKVRAVIAQAEAAGIKAED